MQPGRRPPSVTAQPRSSHRRAVLLVCDLFSSSSLDSDRAWFSSFRSCSPLLCLVITSLLSFSFHRMVSGDSGLVRGGLRLSGAIRSDSRLSGVVRGLPEPFGACSRPSEAVRGCSKPFGAVLKLFGVVRGYSRLPEAVRGLLEANRSCSEPCGAETAVY